MDGMIGVFSTRAETPNLASTASTMFQLIITQPHGYLPRKPEYFA